MGKIRKICCLHFLKSYCNKLNKYNIKMNSLKFNAINITMYLPTNCTLKEWWKKFTITFSLINIPCFFLFTFPFHLTQVNLKQVVFVKSFLNYKHVNLWETKLSQTIVVNFYVFPNSLSNLTVQCFVRSCIL